MKMLKLAQKIAVELKPDKYRVISIITDKRDRILSIGVNSYNKSHPKQAEYAKRVGQPKKIYLHAEVDAILRLKEEGHNIYTVRLNKQGEMRYSKPCPICSLAIKEAGIKYSYYS